MVIASPLLLAVLQLTQPRVLLAFITGWGSPQLSPRTPGPSLQNRTLHGVSLSQILFVLLEFHEVLVIPFLQPESL